MQSKRTERPVCGQGRATEGRGGKTCGDDLPPRNVGIGRLSRRRKGRVKEEATPASEMTGTARLLSETPVATLDLHGYTQAQARPRVRDFLATQSRISTGGVVHIVTGKGLGSDGDAVLPGLVRGMLDDESANQVEEFAGMVGGGGWVVRIR